MAVGDAIADPSAGNIIAAGVGFLPGGDAAKAPVKAGAQILENAAKGNAFEKAVLDSNGMTKNNEKFETPHGNTIPDSMTGGVNEVKGGAYVTDSAQLRAQRDVAAERGVPHNVYVKEDARVSSTVQRESTVIRCKGDGKACEGK